MAVYAPFLLYAGAVLALILTVSLVLRHASFDRQVAILTAVIVVGYGGYAVAIVGAAAGALKRGVYASADVLPGGSRATVQLRGEAVELGFASRRIYRAGERLRVLVDPDKRTILMVLGTA